MRSCLYILCIVFQCLIILLKCSRHLDQPVQYISSHRCFSVGSLQNALTVRQPSCRLIYLTNQTKCPDIPDSLPFNRIGKIGGLFIVALIYQFINLFEFEVVLVLIQFFHPVYLHLYRYFHLNECPIFLL